AENLREADVKIYEARDVILHAKSVAIDGVWSSIGSSNFDRRSVLFNGEVDVVVLGRATGTRMEAIFNEDIGEADRVEPAAWADRSLSERFDELTARLSWEYWLRPRAEPPSVSATRSWVSQSIARREEQFFER